MSDPFDTPGIIAIVVGGGGIMWLLSEGVAIPIIKWMQRNKKRYVLLLGGFWIVACGATGFSSIPPCLACALLYLIVDNTEKKKAAAEAERKATEARRIRDIKEAERKAREVEARWVRESEEAERIKSARIRASRAEAERKKAEAFANEWRKRQRIEDERRNKKAAEQKEERASVEKQKPHSVDARPAWAKGFKLGPKTWQQTPLSEVKKRYRLLAKKNHSDLTHGSCEAMKVVNRWWAEACEFYQSKTVEVSA